MNFHNWRHTLHWLTTKWVRQHTQVRVVLNHCSILLSPIIPHPTPNNLLLPYLPTLTSCNWDGIEIRGKRVKTTGDNSSETNQAEAKWKRENYWTKNLGSVQLRELFHSSFTSPGLATWQIIYDFAITQFCMFTPPSPQPRNLYSHSLPGRQCQYFNVFLRVMSPGL